MSDSNTPVEVVIDDDLDAFSESFFGQNAPVETPASVTEDEKDEAASDALEPVASEESDEDTPVEDDADGNAEEEQPEPVKEPKLTPTQKRINEVVGKQRAAERALEAETAARKALEARIAELTSQNDKAAPSGSEPNDGRPDPSAKNEDGSDKYPLGDFDPEYIRDLMQFENESFRAKYEAEAAQRAEQARMEAEVEAIENNWKEKLGPAKERYPDFEEVGQTLIENFEGLNQDYGEYLMRTLQSMEHGPDVLYYLAQNPDVANDIVNSGPQKATLALGRIEARFDSKESEAPKPRISSAPPVPPQNKGNNAVVVEVPDDTDDLDAFSAKLFKKR
jgi:hypothetical protein